MKETLNYIEVLLWGYSGFAPMSLNVDYNKSIEQLEECLQALESLNYGKMFDEATSANGKANLQRWQATGDSIEYKLPFMKNRRELVSKHIPEMFIAYKQGADRYKADGVWTDEQWREYRVTLSIIEKAFEDRIREFATAYCMEDKPEPQQAQPKQETIASTIPTINDTDKEKLVFGNALKKEYMSLANGCYKWHLTKSLLAYMCGRLYCGDRIKEYDSDYSQEYFKGNTQMPAQEVKALFGVDVASNRYSLKTPPRNSWKVDELFKDKGASK